jgi:thioredoxin 1
MQRINATNFQSEVLEAKVPVMVDFYSDHCGPCRMLAPHLEQMANEFASCAKVVKVNVSEEPELASYFRINAVPTLMLFEDGQLVKSMVGGHPQTIRQLLASRCVA